METPPATVEAPKRNRRWFQFSLRGLMVAVTLLCCVAGVVSSQAIRQRRAVERLKELHAVVYYDFQVDAALKPRTDDPEPPGPDWLRELIGLDYFASVVSVQTNLASDDFVESAAACPHLRDLGIYCDSKISDGAWEHLKQLTTLESLRLRGMRDSAMSNLAPLVRLRHLYVINTNVGDAGLVHLKGLSQLETLELTGTHVTDAGVLELLKDFRQLKTLDLRGTKVTSAGIRELHAALPGCRIYH
jgi:hypothetical protein